VSTPGDQTDHVETQDPWRVFRSWHGQESLWREIYTRTVSALTAAFVIYLVAVFVAGVNRQPALVVTGLLWLLGISLLVFSIPAAVKNRKRVAPLFHTWNFDPAEEMALARRIYNRLIFGLLLTVVGTIFLALLVSGT
jgi:hypothetical protein